MTETIFTNKTVPAGGSVVGTFSKSENEDETVLVIDGDTNTTDIDIVLRRGHPESLDPNDFVPIATSGNGAGSGNGRPKQTNVDVTAYTNNRVLVRFSDTRLLRACEVEVTNNAANDTVLTIEQLNREMNG